MGALCMINEAWKLECRIGVASRCLCAPGESPRYCSASRWLLNCKSATMVELTIAAGEREARRDTSVVITPRRQAALQSNRQSGALMWSEAGGRADAYSTGPENM